MFTGKFSHTALLTLAASMAASAQTPFVISNVHSALVMSVLPSNPLWEWIQQDTPTGGTIQQWVLHRPGTAIAYEIRSVASRMVLNTPLAESGVSTEQVAANGDSNQLWQISRAAGSTGYEIVSDLLEQTNSPGSLPTYAHLALDVPGFSTSSGAYLQEFTENDGTNQQWQFNPVSNAVGISPLLRGSATILVSASVSSIVITGYGFPVSTRVCPVLESAVGLGLGEGSCVTTGDFEGSFNYVYPVPGGYTFSGTGGYVVMTVEDQNQNVLAIGSAPGSYLAKL